MRSPDRHDALNSDIPNPVPYVADFTDPSFNDPTPRPFYCTMYFDYQVGVPTANQGILGSYDRFSAHDWQFFVMPNQVTVSLQSGPLNQLYIDPSWGW